MTEENNFGFGPEWKVSEEDPGYMTQTVVVGRITVEVLRPILTPEERTKREKEIMSSLARKMAPYLRKKEGMVNHDERTA
jgi:hypothetical protein